MDNHVSAFAILMNCILHYAKEQGHQTAIQEIEGMVTALEEAKAMLAKSL